MGNGFTLSIAEGEWGQEQQLSSLANSQFHTSDAWEVYIIDYLQGRSVTTTAQILE